MKDSTAMTRSSLRYLPSSACSEDDLQSEDASGPAVNRLSAFTSNGLNMVMRAQGEVASFILTLGHGEGRGTGSLILLDVPHMSR